MHLLPFWVFLQSEMIDFHTVSYASTSEIHTPTHILRLENGISLCGASPLRPLWGVPPPLTPRELTVHVIYHMRELIKSP